MSELYHLIVPSVIPTFYLLWQFMLHPILRFSIHLKRINIDNSRIRTRHTDSSAEIIVKDTGPGFDPSNESKPHTTLENIRQRLEMMCGGSMTIKPREGGGTVVTITIPDSTERKKEPEKP